MAPYLTVSLHRLDRSAVRMHCPQGVPSPCSYSSTASCGPHCRQNHHGSIQIIVVQVELFRNHAQFERNSKNLVLSSQSKKTCKRSRKWLKKNQFQFLRAALLFCPLLESQQENTLEAIETKTKLSVVLSVQLFFEPSIEQQ